MSVPVQLRLGALTALVVGSMVGGGIFSIPQNTAASAGVGATAIAWLITGVGMLALAFVFLNLALREPALDSGIYAYARAGFGFIFAAGYVMLVIDLLAAPRRVPAMRAQPEPA